MCVIVYVDEKRPDRYMIGKMWDRNRDMGGLAWREGDEVVWQKGIGTEEEMAEIMADLPLPYVAHFRVASSGGRNPELNHPFPVSKKTSLALSGRTKGKVLFHNGDWKEWRGTVWDTAKSTGTPLPPGRAWSDTRALAWLSAIYGESLLDFLGQKGIIFGPKDNDIEIFGGSEGWVEVDGIWCSNNRFWFGQVDKGGVIDTHPQQSHQQPRGAGVGVGGLFCRNTDCGSIEIDGKGYCPQHRPGGTAFDAAVAAQGATGGSRSAIPFLQPQNYLSLGEAEVAFEEGKISKNFLKKCRSYFEKLDMRVKKAQAQQQQRLLPPSQTATSQSPAVEAPLTSSSGPVH